MPASCRAVLAAARRQLFQGLLVRQGGGGGGGGCVCCVVLVGAGLHKDPSCPWCVLCERDFLESAAPRADAAQLPPDAAPASSLGGSGTLGAVPNKYCCYTHSSHSKLGTLYTHTDDSRLNITLLRDTAGSMTRLSSVSLWHLLYPDLGLRVVAR